MQTRISQYEMAFRMQTSVPELVDLTKRKQRDARTLWPRCAQTWHVSQQARCSLVGWSRRAFVPCKFCIAAGINTATCPGIFARNAQDTDQPIAGLLTDLKRRGLLKDTLVVWGGEFGSTVYSPGYALEDELWPRSSPQELLHVDGGWWYQRRYNIGETDDFSYNIVKARAY